MQQCRFSPNDKFSISPSPFITTDWGATHSTSIQQVIFHKKRTRAPVFAAGFWRLCLRGSPASTWHKFCSLTALIPELSRPLFLYCLRLCAQPAFAFARGSRAECGFPLPRWPCGQLIRTAAHHRSAGARLGAGPRNAGKYVLRRDAAGPGKKRQDCVVVCG